MRFAKGHGTENDFVILLDPGDDTGLTAELAARLCDRRAGIGGDGVLRVVRSAAYAAGGTGGPAGHGNGAGGEPGRPAGPAAGAAGPEWFMDYRNSDGSPAEMCGNGIRVFARYLMRHGLAPGPQFTVATRSGPREVRIGAGGEVTAELGAVAVLGPGSAVVAGRTRRGLRMSVGNPHLACLVDEPLAGLDLSRAPDLDPAEFPEGANVELVRVTGPRSVAMRVYERGSGETRSCGTGAVAAAAAAAEASGDGDGTWAVRVPGGGLTVTLEAGRAWLTGPAVIVAEGDLDPAWLTAPGSAPTSPSDHGDMAARTAQAP